MTKNFNHRTTEADVLRACLDYLALDPNRIGYVFWRQNTAPTYEPTRQQYRAMPKYARKGVPDIIVLLPPHGRFLGIEVKGPQGRQSPEQKGFQFDIERAGGLYWIVRSVDDLELLMPDEPYRPKKGV